MSLKKILILVAASVLALALVGCGKATDNPAPKPAAPDTSSSPTQDEVATDLVIEDLTVGEGAEATVGSTAVVHYTGWLADGTMFESSKDSGRPFEFSVGAGRVIAGWDQGVQGMKVGGVRKLTIPSELAYGPQGAGNGVIPPNATLVFEIELLEVK